jgi:hypothetical protein
MLDSAVNTLSRAPAAVKIESFVLHTLHWLCCQAHAGRLFASFVQLFLTALAVVMFCSSVLHALLGLCCQAHAGGLCA